MDNISVRIVRGLPKAMALMSSPGKEREAEFQGSPACRARDRRTTSQVVKLEFSRMPLPKRSRVSKWVPRETQNRPSLPRDTVHLSQGTHPDLLPLPLLPAL